MVKFGKRKDAKEVQIDLRDNAEEKSNSQQQEHEQSSVQQKVDTTGGLLDTSNGKVKEKRKGKKVALIGGVVGVVILAGVLVVGLSGGKSENPVDTTLVADDEIEGSEWDSSQTVHDVSGLLTLEERDKTRKYHEYWDKYLDFTMNLPDDYFLVEKTHLYLDKLKADKDKKEEITEEDVASDLLGLVVPEKAEKTNNFNGVIGLMELESKVYKDIKIYMQLNHRKDYEQPEELTNNSSSFIGKTINYYNTGGKEVDEGSTARPLEEVVATGVDASESGLAGAETEEAVEDESLAQSLKELDILLKQSNAPTPNSQPKETTAGDKLQPSNSTGVNDLTQGGSLGQESQSDVPVAELKDKTAIKLFHNEVENPQNLKPTVVKVRVADGSELERTVLDLGYGAYSVYTRQEWRKTKRTIQSEFTYKPFYLAIELPKEFKQVNDYSFNACKGDYILESDVDDLETNLDSHTPCYSPDGKGYIAPPTLENNKGSNTETTTGSETDVNAQLEDIFAQIESDENLEETETESIVDVDLEGQLEPDNGESDIRLTGTFTQEEYPDLAEMAEKMENSTFTVGDFSVTAKRVDLLKNDKEPFLAYELMLPLKGATLYAVVVSKDIQELLYVLQDVENMLASIKLGNNWGTLKE